MPVNPYPFGAASIDAHQRALSGKGSHDLFFTNRDTTFWQVQAFDNAGQLWRIGDELPTVAGTGLGRYGLSRLAAFQDVGVELPLDYQLSIKGDRGTLGTVSGGRLAEVDVPRDPSLPWLFYNGRLAKAGDQSELETRIRDQTERLERAIAAYKNGLTGTIGPFYNLASKYEDAIAFYGDEETGRATVDHELETTVWSELPLPSQVPFADFLYIELTPEQQRREVEMRFQVAAKDHTGFTGKTRKQIHEVLLRQNREHYNCEKSD